MAKDCGEVSKALLSEELSADRKLDRALSCLTGGGLLHAFALMAAHRGDLRIGGPISRPDFYYLS